MDWVCVLAPTAGSRASVVAALAHGDTSFSREVAQEAGEEHCEERRRRPADAAVRLRAREGLVSARVLVVAGAVVEEPLDAADARPILHRALRRAHAPVAAHPAGREHPRAAALWAPAPAAILALVGVRAVIFVASAAWRGQNGSALTAQGLQLFGIQLRAFRLGSDYLVTAWWAAEETLARRSTPYAGPDAALGVLCAGGPQHALPGRDGRICVSILSQ